MWLKTKILLIVVLLFLGVVSCAAPAQEISAPQQILSPDNFAKNPAAKLIALTATPSVVPPSAEDSPQISEESVTIDSFDYELGSEGDSFTLRWTTRGATQGRIYGGLNQYSVDFWDIKATQLAEGSQFIAVNKTLYRDPMMTLVVSDENGHVAVATINVPWPCEEPYFFSESYQPYPIPCPDAQASAINARQLRFEQGLMIWVSRLRLPGTEGTIRENRMYVFIDFGNGEGNWRRIDDIPVTTRSFSGEPPTGLFTPQNEFGIVWQEQGFTEDLGWATSAGGRALTTEWQWQAGESGAAVAYVRTADGEIIELYGSNRGGWRYLNE